MKIVRLAREKLVEKDIKWGEVYTDKTEFLKEQYNDVIGPGSYYRFEGKEGEAGDEYYCIIGPAKVHKPKAKWFAGVRKLPATFSAGGKYFDSLDAAAKYARETWGVPTPKTLKPYTSAALFGISKKIKDWKEKREEAESSGSDNESEEAKEAASNILLVTAAGYNEPSPEYEGHKPRTKVYPEEKYNVDKMVDSQTGQIIADSPEYTALVESVVKDPWFEATRPTEEAIAMKQRGIVSMIQKAYDEKQRKIDDISAFYGVPREFAESMEHMFITYKPGNERNSGLTLTGIGPYVSMGERHGEGNIRKDAWGKFNVYHLKKRNASEAEILSTADGRLAKMNEEYGLTGTPNELTRSDMSYTLGGYGDDGKDRVSIPSLGPESQAQMDELFSVAPIEGDGALMPLNNSGQGKVISSLAERDGISLEEALEKYADDIKWDTYTGAQNFTESKRDDTLTRDLEVVQKVLGVLPGDTRLTGSTVKKWREYIIRELYKTDRMLSDREIDKAISQVVQMQKPTKKRPARNVFELYEDNREAIESTFDQTNYETEDEAFAKANVAREKIEQKDYETELPFDDKVDDTSSQQLQADRLRMLRTIRVLQDLQSAGVTDIDVPAITEEQKVQILKMSPKAYQLNRRRYKAFEDLMNDPEVQALVDGPGREDTHKVDRTKGALEGVNEVLDVDKEEFADEIMATLPEEGPSSGVAPVVDRVAPLDKEEFSEGYTPKRDKLKKNKKRRPRVEKLEDDLDLPDEDPLDFGSSWDDSFDGPFASKSKDLKQVYASSLKRLISIAREMDNKGKYSASEEIHKIIRKYKS